MKGSFRLGLALRAAGAVALGMAGIAFFTFVTVREILDGELNASILGVASIQAASLTDGEQPGSMHMHEWELTADEATSLKDLIRYAQVWRSDGTSLLRSRFMTEDLPVATADLGTASGGELLWTEALWRGEPVRSLLYPLARFGEGHGGHVLQVTAPLATRNEMLTRVGAFLLALSAVISLWTFLGAWWLAGRAIRPVEEIIDQAETIEATSLDQPIRAYAEVHEYRRLVDVLNGMLERISRAFETQRRFTSDASHELRTPLTAMRGEIEIALRRRRSEEEYRATLGSTLEEVIRLTQITEDLLLLARSDARALPRTTAAADLSEVAGRVVARLKPRADARSVGVALHAAGEAWVDVDPGALGQVAWNVIDNAIKFSHPGGTVVVEVSTKPGAAQLTVADSGPGFAEPERVFERFYRGDAARTHHVPSEGTGLGLAIVQGIVTSYGGAVEVANIPSGGGKVSVRLPVAGPGAAGGRDVEDAPQVRVAATST